MTLKMTSIFLILILLNFFCAETLQAMDTPDPVDELSSSLAKTSVSSGHFVRVQEDNIIARYAKAIEYKDAPIVTILPERSDKCLHLVKEFAKKDGYKNHMLASSFISFDPITTKNFFKEPAEQDKVIDWASPQSKISPLCVKKGQEHSEVEFINYINDIMKTVPCKIEDTFFEGLKFVSFNKPTDILFFGIEFFGSFDNCDACLQALYNFRKPGQASLKNFLTDKLRDKGWTIDSDFEKAPLLILSNSYYPYKSLVNSPAVYSIDYNDKIYTCEYNYSFEGDTRIDNFALPMKEALKAQVLKQLPSIDIQAYLDTLPIISKNAVLDGVTKSKENNSNFSCRSPSKN